MSKFEVKLLTLSQTTHFYSSKLKESAKNFMLDENDGKYSKRVENTMGTPIFPVFSKGLYSRHMKTMACLEKG